MLCGSCDLLRHGSERQLVLEQHLSDSCAATVVSTAACLTRLVCDVRGTRLYSSAVCVGFHQAWMILQCPSVSCTVVPQATMQCYLTDLGGCCCANRTRAQSTAIATYRLDRMLPFTNIPYSLASRTQVQFFPSLTSAFLACFSAKATLSLQQSVRGYV